MNTSSVSAMTWIFGVLVVAAIGAALVALLIVRHNLRVRRVRASYRALPATLRRQALDLIGTAGRRNRWATLAVPADSPPTDLLVTSHMGGVPYAEAGETWPKQQLLQDGTEDPASPPAEFLMQMRLSEPGLGPIWEGRLVSVWLRHDPEAAVRVHERPDALRYGPLDGPAPGPAIALEDVPIPRLAPARAPDDDPVFPGSPGPLLESVPGLLALLREHTSDAAGLLAQLLYPERYGYDVEGADAAYQGGEPELIQNPHEATCPDCRQPMRFLFQFGDWVPGVQIGDAGVVYVYGCDTHPNRTVGYIDTH